MPVNRPYAAAACCLWYLALPAGVAAQAVQIAVKQCREPKEPLGTFHAVGVIRATLLRDGKVDTTTIEVGSVTGLPAAGMRSVAARQLSACSFSVQPKPAEAFAILQRFIVDSGKVQIASIPAAGASFAPMAIPVPTIPAEPAVWPDSMVEEHSRPLACKGGMTPASSQTMDVRADNIEEAQRELERRYAGTARFAYTVGTDGRFVPGSSRVLSSTAPSLAHDAISLQQGCLHAPGRIQGIAVPVEVEIRFEARVETH